MIWEGWPGRGPRKFLLLGMVHLPPLPGSPLWGGSMEAVLDAARKDAQVLVDGGLDGVIVENFGDAPFLPGPAPPETVAAMTLAVREVRDVIGRAPVLGVNLLRNDARGALGVAFAAGADLIRVNVHTGSMWTDQGLIHGRAWETLRDRARLEAPVAVAADVLAKHGDPPTRVDPGRRAVETVERGLADAVIVTGSATGQVVDPTELVTVSEAVRPRVPVLVGSGVDAATLSSLARHADGAIVGTWLRRNGRVEAPVDRDRVRELAALRDGLTG